MTKINITSQWKTLTQLKRFSLAHVPESKPRKDRKTDFEQWTITLEKRRSSVAQVKFDE